MGVSDPVIRQVKIALITDTENPIIEWFENLWGELESIQTNVHLDENNEVIYYRNSSDGKKWVFYISYDTQYYCFSFNYVDFVQLMVNEFKLSIPGIKTVMGILFIENKLNIPYHPRYYTMQLNDPIYGLMKTL